MLLLKYHKFYLFRKVAVLGAGLMGAGIAQVTIDKGVATVLKDISSSALARGEGQIHKNLSLDVKKRKISAYVSAKKLFLLSGQ